MLSVSDPPRRPTGAPALLDVKEVAELLHCSPRHVYRLSDAAKMPRPVRLGALIRWRRDELDAWLSAGCPPDVRRRARRSDELLNKKKNRLADGPPRRSSPHPLFDGAKRWAN